MTPAETLEKGWYAVPYFVLLAGGDSYIATIFTNIANTVKAVGSYVILILGLALIIVSVIHIVQGFAANGRTAWLMTFGSLLFGGFLVFGGWAIITGVMGGTGKNTLDNIMRGMTPTTAQPITQISDTKSGMDTARNAVAVLTDGFFVPFAQTVAVSVGVVMVIMAVVQIAKYFMSKGKGQISLVKVGVIALLGSVLFAATPTDNSAGWMWIVNTAVGATRDTVVNAAEGSSTSQSNGYASPNFNINDSQSSEIS